MPTLDQSGAAGGQVMGGLIRRGMAAFMASVSGLTIVTGIWLYWRFTSGFDPTISGSNAGLAFGSGAVAGLAAGIIEGSVIGRASKNLVALGEQAARLADGPERTALFQRIEATRKRIGSSSQLVIVLLILALVLMSIGHYV
jgi:hypothetical protein